jgi:hypothetical protein
MKVSIFSSCSECVYLFDAGNGVVEVCGVLCMSNVKKQWGS